MAKFDLAQDVTNKIIELMENSGSNWLKPWVNQSNPYPQNVATKNFYKGINIFLLHSARIGHGFKHNLWGTYKQWASVGAKVMPGQHSPAYVVFWKINEYETTDKNGEPSKKTIPFLRYSPVYNVDQVEGYNGALLLSDDESAINPDEKLAHVQKFIQGTEARIRFGGSRACFIPSHDLIEMPEFKQFKSAEAYYGTIFHELTHWTGAKKRLDRNLQGRFGSQSYAFEELVAELGAAMSCAHLGVSMEPREDHAKYLNNWLEVLNNDKQAIIKAATLAGKALDYMVELNELSEVSAA